MESNYAIMLESTTEKLRELLNNSNVDPGHGIEHALAVREHAKGALKYVDASIKISEDERYAVLLAATLHDSDDPKFFPVPGSSTAVEDLPNARILLSKWPHNIIELTLEMIRLVSCSKNGNENYAGPAWMLIPRFCDRIEALGEIGIKRCYDYTVHTGRPLHTPNTPRARTREEVLLAASPERFRRYMEGAKSESMIDHYYDKLLHIAIETGNEYIDAEMKARRIQMIDYVVNYWTLNA